MTEERPVWRTSTVVSLCKAMRAEKNYEGLPILADALEEAGYPDASTLAKCRGAKTRGREPERIVCRVLGGELAEAVQWIEDTADGCDVSYTRMMDLAERMMDVENRDPYGEYIHMGDNESYKNYFWGHEEEFWKHYEAITGNKPGKEAKENSFFSCSC